MNLSGNPTMTLFKMLILLFFARRVVERELMPAWLRLSGDNIVQLLHHLDVCQYVRHYVLEMEKEDEDLNWEFVARELVAITGVFDLADEVGRQHLVSLVKALLTSSRTPASIIPALVEVFSRVEKDPQSRVNQVAEVISELKDPMQSSTQKGQAPISAGSDTFFDAAETLRPSPKKNAAAVQVTTCAILGYFNCSS